jgi:hypothetical protein
MQPGPEDLPKTFPVTLSANEWAALTYLRDTTFPGQPLELLIRKLTQDGLLACGVLKLPKGNRAKMAGTK